MSDFWVGLVKSKTAWVNAIVLLATIFASDAIRPFISPEVLVKLQAVINILLRLVTTQSLTEKGRAGR